MNREELYEYLDIETPEDFTYFEQFADLVECEENIEFDDFYNAISKISAEELSTINENYFAEIEKAFPDDCDDFCEVFTAIKDNLTSLVSDTDNEVSRREYAEQLFNFHEMYTKEDGAILDGNTCSVMSAITESRISKFDGKAHTYNFDNSLDYTPDYIYIKLGGFEKDEQ